MRETIAPKGSRLGDNFADIRILSHGGKREPVLRINYFFILLFYSLPERSAVQLNQVWFGELPSVRREGHLYTHISLPGSMNSVAEVLSGVGVALVTLILIITPVSTAVLHSSISANFNKSEWNRQIIRSCLYLTAILIVFLVAGHFVMVATILPALKSGVRRNDDTVPPIQVNLPDGEETSWAVNEGTTVVIQKEAL